MVSITVWHDEFWGWCARARKGVVLFETWDHTTRQTALHALHTELHKHGYAHTCSKFMSNLFDNLLTM